VAEPPAVDASPLIVLAQGGYLELLRIAGDRVMVPRPVADEILRGDVADAAVQALTVTSWLEMVEIGPAPDALRAFGLDRGEEAVLAWALAHSGALAIIDDMDGRRAARTLGIPFVGTLGLVVEAKLRGVIPAARPVIDHLLRRTSWYLSERERERALRRVGE
jgi:predicted nucleic acid-binding protein